MAKRYYILIIAALFLLVSGIIYLVHYLIFHDVYHIFFYLIGDLAFLPLEVLLVVILIERILTRRETQIKLQKLNMVVGAFFSEIGNDLLKRLLPYFNNREQISQHLNVTEIWTKRDFQRAADFAYQLPVDIDVHNIDLEQIKELLSSRREFILTLLENPSLLEHDRFTDLLWAVTHLDEELEARPSLNNLTDKDLEHVIGDIRRLYDHLASEWLDYVWHLKSRYPFLFSLILRTHPFQKNPTPSVT